MNGSEAGTVLVVDDDPDVVSTYRHYLEEEYEVLTASDSGAVLSILDAGGVDVVLLDRRMPGLSGTEILDRIRENGVDCMVAMVTAVGPDFDIVDMGFDAYVTKPTNRAELRRTVDDLCSLDRYADRIREYHSLLGKRATLQSEKSRQALDDSEAYADLLTRIDEVEREVDEVATAVDDATFVATIRAIDRGGSDTEARRDG